MFVKCLRERKINKMMYSFMLKKKQFTYTKSGFLKKNIVYLLTHADKKVVAHAPILER